MKVCLIDVVEKHFTNFFTDFSFKHLELLGNVSILKIYKSLRILWKFICYAWKTKSNIPILSKFIVENCYSFEEKNL